LHGSSIARIFVSSKTRKQLFNNLTLPIMATIINNNDFTLSVKMQSLIQNAAANAGVEKVIVSVKSRQDDGELIEVYDEEDNLLCNGDTAAEIIF